ncbi:MAG: Phosphate starvation-inducible protein PsiF [Stenotrophomonas maltophilia]|nr:MAG: Phosphate starvation-inducible protein PsiF [Stenotrophomonas maltophilia]
MNRLRVPLLLLALAFSAQGFAANTAQQDKMKTCNADATAKSLKGDERKTFMSTCLKAGSTDTKQHTAQQQKMVQCNKDAKAKNLAGDERKTFMSTCLKK